MTAPNQFDIILAIKRSLHANGELQPFIGQAQRLILASSLDGEEATGFAELVAGITTTVKTMPVTYQQDGKGDNAVVYLHYFKGNVNAWITELDVIDKVSQAYGLVDLGYGPELGYICITELIEAGMELDLHWQTKTIGEIKKEQA